MVSGEIWILNALHPRGFKGGRPFLREVNLRRTTIGSQVVNNKGAIFNANAMGVS